MTMNIDWVFQFLYAFNYRTHNGNQRKRDRRGTKRGNRHRPNRVKRWLKECGRRKVKMQKMAMLPHPPPLMCNMNRNELEDVWGGFKRTRAYPHIYYKENDGGHSKSDEEFVAVWKKTFTEAVTGRWTLSIRFKAIPEMEDSDNDIVRIEPTAKHGFQLRQKHGGELLNTRFEIDRHIFEELRPATEFNPEPPANWSPTSWKERSHKRHRLLHSRFRDTKLKRKNRRRKSSGSLLMKQTLTIPGPVVCQDAQNIAQE